MSQNINFAIPVKYKDKIYTSAELKQPSAEDVAYIKEEADKGDVYKATYLWVVGGIKAIHGNNEIVENKEEIKKIVRYMPFRTAEQVGLWICFEIDEDDGIEGIYSCPMCGTKIVCRYTDEEDTRDFIKENMSIVFMEEYTNISINLDSPFNLKFKSVSTNEEKDLSVNSFEMRHPTINDCILSKNKYGAGNNSTKRQFAINTLCVISVDGEEVDDKDRNLFVYKMFCDIGIKDLKKIMKEITKYGVDNRIEKICHNCGNSWKAEVNTGNFFVSALQ